MICFFAKVLVISLWTASLAPVEYLGLEVLALSAKGLKTGAVCLNQSVEIMGNDLFRSTKKAQRNFLLPVPEFS